MTTTPTAAATATAGLRHPDRLYIGGQWVRPSTGGRIAVRDSATEEVFLEVAEAREADMAGAVAAARQAFDDGPWPSLGHRRRAEHLRALAAALRERSADIADLWPRESGVLHSTALHAAGEMAGVFEYYAGLAESFAFEAPFAPRRASSGVVLREPVGVVGAIIPWNSPLGLITYKLAPALLAGCTVVLKSSPEAPGEGYVIAEVADDIGLPPGVVNVVTADREVSELLVQDPRVDKITFTGSTATGRRIAAICARRIARCNLELGGKSAAVILDDADIDAAATSVAAAECNLTGQICASLTRVIVSRDRHDDMVDALAARFSTVRVGDPFDPGSHMGPLVSERQRQRVLGYLQAGAGAGAVLAAGGGVPSHLPHGYYVEPTVFGNVDNSSTLAQEEIFGPVLAVIPADSEDHAVALANDTIYGLNANVFTPDARRALDIARRLRSGSVGHNGFGPDGTVAFGGYKQSGIGREAGVDGLLPYLETKSVFLDG